MKNSDKQFMVFWDSDGYANDEDEEVQKLGLDFFTIDKGYSVHEIDKIRNMEVKDTIDFGYEEHIITRIK